MANVRVAVRVRPFNSREKEMNAKCVIKMSGNSTAIYDPNASNKEASKRIFAYDYSYWSFDPKDSHFANQDVVFNDLGLDVLKNAWEGYNVSMFAYGQTGAGKSYSMLGYGEDKGIIPRVCEELFNRINNNTNPLMSYKVEVSFLEIYNEQCNDLLNKKGTNLKVKTPPKGVYVEGLSTVVVTNLAALEKVMEDGTASRTVAATKMNATSSRSHAIFTVIFTQNEKDELTGKVLQKASKINLVDLAGSERAASTGASGATLKEGAQINLSLSTLGRVISALAEGDTKGKVIVPYRDSVLTLILKESLGGNAKTIMIAAISPADVNFDETLGTLRYAERAKMIKNKAIINEDPNTKMVRELREEIAKLKAQLGTGGGAGGAGGGGGRIDPEKEKQINEEMEKKLKDAREQFDKEKAATSDLLSKQKQDFEEKMKELEVKMEKERADMEETKKKVEEEFVQKQQAQEQAQQAKQEYEDKMKELQIKMERERMEVEEAKKKMEEEFAQKQAAKEQELVSRQKMFLEMKQRQEEKAVIMAEERRQEQDRRDKLQQDMVRAMVMLSEANSITEEIQRPIKYHLKLNVCFGEGSVTDRLKQTEVKIEAKNSESGQMELLPLEEFEEKMVAIREAYQNFIEKEELPVFPEGADPFQLSSRGELLLGAADLYLRPLYYFLDCTPFETPIIDFSTGSIIGNVTVGFRVIKPQKTVSSEPEDPGKPQLVKIGDPFTFEVEVLRVKDINKTDKYDNIKVVYCLNSSAFADKKYYQSTINCVKKGHEFEANHKQVITIPSLTEELITFMKYSSITLQVFGVVKQASLSLEGTPASPAMVEGLLAEEYYEFVCSIEITEDRQPVPIKEELYKKPSVMFKLKQFKSRQIVVSMVECFASVHIVGCEDAKFTSVGMEDEDEEFDEVPLTVESITRTQITFNWNNSAQYSSLLSAITPKSKRSGRIIANLSFAVELSNFSAPLVLEKPVCFRIYDKDAELTEGAQYESLRLMAVEQKGAAEKQENGLMFGLSIKKERKLNKEKAATALIEDHQNSVSQVERLVAAEKFRQESALQELLIKNGIKKRPLPSNVAPVPVGLGIPSSPTPASPEAPAAADGSKPPTRGRKRHDTIVKIQVKEILKRQYDKGGYLYKKGGTSSGQPRWKKLWFELRKPYLYFYQAQEESKERGTFELINCMATLAQEADRRFTFAIASPRKVWILQAASEEERAAWMLAIDPSLQFNAFNHKAPASPVPVKQQQQRPAQVAAGNNSSARPPAVQQQALQPQGVQADDFELSFEPEAGGEVIGEDFELSIPGVEEEKKPAPVQQPVTRPRQQTVRHEPPPPQQQDPDSQRCVVS
eukprot:TRINITY_DN2837_c0_g1_i1.p1 TRINITY_DN2837_c0_g1~~TRINITY_DN2837_c0_g1_i1.p1  ORF type:complete len:1343 (-),score=433.86 TRINITY_DN2837_c0_g1_i1:127-4155(-)